MAIYEFYDQIHTYIGLFYIIVCLYVLSSANFHIIQRQHKIPCFLNQRATQ